MISVHLVVSCLFVYKIFVYELCFPGNWPDYTVENSNGCSISPFNNTALIFETPNPYIDNSDCVFNFNCRNGESLVYSIERFGIESHATCDYDYLGTVLRIIQNITSLSRINA